MIRPIVDRIDLRISLSKAKFDEEVNFELRLVVAPQKLHQISEKRNFRSEIFAKQKFVGVEKCNVGNRLKRVLAKFRADRSHVRGVNGRSKFQKKLTPKTTNGRKIARIAPILTIFSPNRSRRPKLNFEKF